VTGHPLQCTSPVTLATLWLRISGPGTSGTLLSLLPCDVVGGQGRQESPIRGLFCGRTHVES
jgi:hypothetical protein